MTFRTALISVLIPAAAFVVGWSSAPAPADATAPASPAREAGKQQPVDEVTARQQRVARIRVLEALSDADLIELFSSEKANLEHDFTFLQSVATELGRRLGGKAMEVVTDTPAKWRTRLQRAVLRGWAETDVVSAMRWDLNVGKDNNANYLWGQAGRNIEHLQTLLALEGMTSSLREELLAGAVAHQQSLPMPELMAWVDTLTVEQRSYAIPRLLRWMAASNPAAAAGLLATLPPERWGSHAAKIAEHWARADPLATLRWLDDLPPNDTSWNARVGSVSAWADSDPNAAWRYLASLSPVERNSLLTSETERELPARMVDALLQSTDAEIRDELRAAMRAAGFEQRVLREEIFDLASSDPAAAIAQVAGMGEVSESMGETLEAVAERIAESDPASAIAFATSLPSHHRHNGIAGAVARWVREDPEAALGFIYSMESDRDHAAAIDAFGAYHGRVDHVATAAFYTEQMTARAFNRNDGFAAGNIVSAWFELDPAAVGAWAASLPSESNMRSRAISTLHQRWSKYGAETAAARLEALGIAPDEFK